MAAIKLPQLDPFLLPLIVLLLLLFQISLTSCSFHPPHPPPPPSSSSNSNHPISPPDFGDYYSDQAYYDYASSYQDANLRLTADLDYDRFDHLDDDDYANPPPDADSDKEQASSSKGKLSLEKKNKKAESYSEMGSRLNCDNPWFWNAIKCTWVDVKGKTISARTKANATTSAWIVGSLLCLFLCCCGGSCCVLCLKYRKRWEMLKLREKYTPGRLELSNGRVVQFQPTEEEEKAYEELVKAIAIQEMV